MSHAATNLLPSFSRKENLMSLNSSADLVVSGSFTSTVHEIVAESEKGEAFLEAHFGFGAISARIRASRSGSLTSKAREAGLTVRSR